MKPLITLDNILAFSDLCSLVFEAIAELKHYKVLYLIMQEKKCSITSARIELLKNKEFSEAAVEWVNKDENRCNAFTHIIDNYSSLNVSIPLRDCDFKVDTDDYSVSYYWIDERIELSNNDGCFLLAKLIVDDKSNILYYDLIDGDGVSLYSESGKVGLAYKAFLAERELFR